MQPSSPRTRSSAQIIRTANSSLFGFIFKTADIETAIIRLGISRVRAITMGMAAGQLFRGTRQIGTYTPLRVWTHSVAVGIMAEVIAESASRKEVRELSGSALLAGLVHDIGIILEDQFMPDEFATVALHAAKEKLPIFRAEMPRWQFDHAGFGAAVLRRWRIPEDIAVAVAQHHSNYDRKDPILVHIVMMAEILASASGHGFTDVTTFPRTEFGHLQSRLGLMGRVFNNVRTTFDTRIKEALALFAVDEDTSDEDAGDEEEE